MEVNNSILRHSFSLYDFKYFFFHNYFHNQDSKHEQEKKSPTNQEEIFISCC